MCRAYLYIKVLFNHTFSLHDTARKTSPQPSQVPLKTRREPVILSRGSGGHGPWSMKAIHPHVRRKMRSAAIWHIRSSFLAALFRQLDIIPKPSSSLTTKTLCFPPERHRQRHSGSGILFVFAHKCCSTQNNPQDSRTRKETKQTPTFVRGSSRYTRLRAVTPPLLPEPKQHTPCFPGVSTDTPNLNSRHGHRT